MKQRELWQQKKVSSVYGKSRTSIYFDVKRGLFPPAIKVGLQAVRWPSDEVLKIVAARVAGHGDDVIQALVAQLITDRKADTVCGGAA